ncbi:MAG: homoserine O-acetyltransferase [Alphaproteobacteria bacterium]|nr:homoserine O-acetyltransferase [Alphaproteobacteria bacterium]
MTKRLFALGWSAFFLVGIAFTSAVSAQDLIVEKQVFSMPSLTTENGEVIKDVKVGWEAYGTLNADKDNAILICHYFSGTSHAAGKYTPEDEKAGYWDAIIGPGKAVDTNKYYVLSSDTLVNLNVHDPNVTTTGPASINPDTGKPYGMSFPVVGMRDFVNVQKALLDSLGIKKLVAVMGASGGSVQTIEWAAAYPDMVPKAIPVISPGLHTHPFVIGMLKMWNAPILADPKWNGGDYYGGEPPLSGLSSALQLVTMNALYFDWAENKFQRAWADEKVDPEASFAGQFQIESFLDGAGAARAKISDANHFLYMSKANMTYSVADEIDRIKADFLFLPAEGDLIFPVSLSEGWAAKLREKGLKAEVVPISGPFGHVNGLFKIADVADRITAFLEE